MVQENVTPKTKETAIAYLMKNYADYNLWANTTLINFLKTKPAALLEQEVPSSFPSVRLTLLHMWQTECYWLSVIKHETPPPAKAFSGTIEEVFKLLIKSSAELARLIRSMSEVELQERTLIESPWFRCDFRNFEYIMQVANHSTYHRGQVVTIGRNLGFTDAPNTDYNFYNIDGKEL